jgi:Putative lipoprotein
LILPQKTEAYRAAAQALRAGFMAAAKTAQAEDSCLVIEHEAGRALYAFQEAQEAGARVIVGPLVRDDLRMLVHMPPDVWTIALTQLEDDDTPMPDKIFPLTLTVESDARLLARELLLSGKTTNVALLSSETPLMKRFSDAFMDEWLKIGEAPPQRILYQADELADLRTKLGTLAPSAVILAVEGNDAALAYAQTKAWPTYASGHIYQRASQFEGFPFDRLRVVEIPWLVNRGDVRFHALGTAPDSPATARLYALGFDAFQVATSFLGGAPLSLDIQGASGHIRFDPREGLLRNGQMAIFDGGGLRALNE